MSFKEIRKSRKVEIVLKISLSSYSAQSLMITHFEHTVFLFCFVFENSMNLTAESGSTELNYFCLFLFFFSDAIEPAFKLVPVIDRSTESLMSNASLGIILPCDQSKVDSVQAETILAKAVRSRPDKPNEKMQKKLEVQNVKTDTGFSPFDFPQNILSSSSTCPSNQLI